MEELIFSSFHFSCSLWFLGTAVQNHYVFLFVQFSYFLNKCNWAEWNITCNDLDTVSVVNVHMKSETWNNSVKIMSANQIILEKVFTC